MTVAGLGRHKLMSYPPEFALDRVLSKIRIRGIPAIYLPKPGRECERRASSYRVRNCIFIFVFNAVGYVGRNVSKTRWS